MHTKKNLEVRFQLSDNTIYKTLKVCGLDTSKTEYTDEEIKQFFIPARRLLDAGKNYKDVEKYFSIKEAGGVSEADIHSSANGSMDGMSQEIFESVNLVVKSAVSDIISLMPQMVASALEEESQKGSIRQAFEKFRQSYIEQRLPINYSTSTTPHVINISSILGEDVDFEDHNNPAAQSE